MCRSERLSSSPLRFPAPAVDHPAYDCAVSVVARLDEAGHEAYIVGGSVRDMLLGATPKDFDIVTSATPEQTQELFERSIPVGEKFGVITVIADGRQFEVATFRADGIYSDGRRPDWVRFAGLKEDVGRRDFTINGLVLDPRKSEILDHTGGVEDLRRGVIRTIGPPSERFSEDALRLVRAVRFASRLGFRIDRGTRRDLVARAHTIQRVAPERVFAELEQMWAGPGRAQALSLFLETHLLDYILPEVATLGREATGSASLWERTRRRTALLPRECPSPVVWASVLADAVAPEPQAPESCDNADATSASGILDRLRPPGKLVRETVAILSKRWVWRNAAAMRRGILLGVLRRDTDGMLLPFWRTDAASRGLVAMIEPIERERRELCERGRLEGGSDRPPFTGADLLAAGMSPGPRVGSALAEMERLWLEGAFTDEGAAARWLRGVAGSEPP